ncbi:MAG: ChbG/HpnK family deacetylase [Chloroflexi bacterium]|nr:ChbG/HpnK family deacetylase [Chloroflexota bacterium]
MTATLEMLGFAPDERVLIIHADDVGFCHASSAAAFEGMSRGSLTCGSALTAAPWFAETARLAREHPEGDLGVHLSLVAEHEACRWRSLTGDPSLHAPDGGMWRNAASAVEHVTVEAARAELRAQIVHALAMGVDVTHIDTHTEALFHPKFIAMYVDLALEYRLPLFFFRPSEQILATLGERAPMYLEQLRRLDEHGWPLLDHVIARTMLEIEPEEKVARFRRFFSELRPGLTLFITHPALGGDELDAIDPIGGRYRAKEGEIFRTRGMREYCESLGIRLIGYRVLRDRLRA